MPDLTRWWRFIETQAGRTAVLREWRDSAGEAFPVIQPLLQTVEREARYYPHPHLPGHWLRIERHRDKSIVAVSEPDCRVRIPLQPPDVVLYQLDIRQLRLVIAHALSLLPCRDFCETDVLTVRVGDWEAEAGQSCPVSLAIATERSMLLAEVQRLVLTSSCPFILLTPTRNRWTADVSDLLRRNRAMALALCDVLASDGTTWFVTERWQSAQETFRRVLRPEGEVEEPYVFRQEGEMWVVTFEGETTHVEDGLGPRYIVQLLQSPGKDIHVEYLYGAVRTLAEKKTDPKTLSDAKAEYHELLERRGRVDRYGDPAELDRINKDIRALARYVKRNTALGGRIARQDDVDKTRRKVCQAIDRTLKQIKKKLRKAARHLDNAIKRGRSMCYAPEENLKWSL